MELVAFIGKDKENWGQVTALINRFDCERVVLIKDRSSGEFPLNEKCVILEVDSSSSIANLKEDIKNKLKRELSNDFEIALSLASGSGKEHMALISALLNVPLGIKLIAYTKNGIEFLS